MKGQFFVMATVIMIFTLMALIRYFYDFSDINLPKLKEISELNYIPYIKESLNTTVASYTGDCDKLQEDLNATKNFLENEMIKRGINLTINYTGYCPPIGFNFTIRTSNLYTETAFTTSLICGDGICEDGDGWCPADASACLDNMCYEPICMNGCGEIEVPNGGTDEACNAAGGCDFPPCYCDGSGNCISGGAAPSTQKLYVDGNTSDMTDWTVGGSEPYLDDTNNGIYSNTANTQQGYFEFANSAAVGEINSVEIKIER
jgi:hypothetical protein